ncbi:hypothetical protein HOU25_gp39 [Corynebacterium phage Juicebox]|uniref:Glutaredoxin n=1 Tax=Corynebacterium phage Juicebox TaxID=2301600 RepID=A0A385UDC2_9CAUD|nr:hypothetical protein HOU25_gp39 [Corynebacterium phage Juicebox]AYB69468.1 hypothetical protein JUICEBOX_39 [Corynebacterium phage Juicebox]
MIREDLRGLKPLMAEPLSVVMWTAPGCAHCRRTESMLARHEVPVSTQPLDDDILEFADSMGFREAPVVLGVRPDGTSTWWAGLDFGKIAEFVGLARKAADHV